MASRTSTELLHPDVGELRFTDVLAALSDPVRLAIVARLAEAESEAESEAASESGAGAAGGELACATFALPVSKSTQSGHFKVLREAGVIRQRDEGTRRLNRLRRDDLDARFPGLLDLAVPQGRAVIAGW
ncbi:ArsR/SmtB family transcription factor [Nonomuraea jiangxiensis]|uniref:DNA-binding transcriptional regulator, ArsR family n=1 Tax=Nonomuraea jiangxiensis TaxID=633440 RepID=A0A1G8JEC0_9ACTN|nr:helix-turn-helix domain-containing protein [Nonomuraea jiangxiensis]SDI29619.1 DNA-binding transcriptional regulator, ArsR family [Nonomuraea jiangxiensis]